MTMLYAAYAHCIVCRAKELEARIEPRVWLHGLADLFPHRGHEGAGGVVAGPGLAVGDEPAAGHELTDVADGLLVAEVGVLLVDGAADLRVREGGEQDLDDPLVQADCLDAFDQAGPCPRHHVEAALGLLGLAVMGRSGRTGSRAGCPAPDSSAAAHVLQDLVVGVGVLSPAEPLFDGGELGWHKCLAGEHQSG